MAKLSGRRILRRGVFQDDDKSFCVLHALFEAIQDEEYCAVTTSNERHLFVRRMAKDMRKTLPVWVSASSSFLDVFSIYASVNVIVFHYSYARPEDVQITFAGNRYVNEWRSLLLIQSSSSDFEPISADDTSVWAADMAGLRKLFESFCPREHQFFQRFATISQYCGGKLSQILLTTSTEEKKCVALQLGDDPEFLVPVIQSEPIVTLASYSTVPHSKMFANAEKLLFLLRDLSQVAPEFAPTRGLLGIDGLVHAIVLADKRLICHLTNGVAPSTFGNSLLLEQNTSFIGIPASFDAAKCDIGLALGENTRSVIESFRRLLRCVYVRTRGALIWEGLTQLECRERRRKIQEVFVEPVMRNNGAIPIAPHVMCAMLVAFCDHHPDPESWDFAANWEYGDLCTETKTQTSGAEIFASPKEYLSWVARRTQ